MPGMDKTGPFGNGSMGKGRGSCGGRQAGRGGGSGFRRGGGRGMMSTTPSPDEEKGMLEQQKGWLETQLAAIIQKLQGFEKNKE